MGTEQKPDLPGGIHNTVLPGLHLDLGGTSGPAVSSGTVSTSAGPLTWSFASPNVLNAQGGGQQLTITVSQGSGGASQSELVFCEAGQPPYLTISGAVKNAQRSFSIMVSAGQSQLTLAVTGIDASVSAGTAEVSGSWQGSSVSWTGPVNLAANPFSGSMVPGWPSGAFSSELRSAAIFAALGTAGTPPPATSTPAPAGGLQALDIGLGTIGRGIVIGAFGALAAAATGGAGAAVLAWGLAGFDGSVVSEELTEWGPELIEPIDFQAYFYPPDPPPPPPPVDPEPGNPPDPGEGDNDGGDDDGDGDASGAGGGWRIGDGTDPLQQF
jgi:hypothetical protein